MQTFPQAPQLFGSFCRSKQPPPPALLAGQQVEPPPHGGPPLQTQFEPTHWLPSVQAGLQLETVHMPIVQPSPAGHM